MTIAECADCDAIFENGKCPICGKTRPDFYDGQSVSSYNRTHAADEQDNEPEDDDD